jgi:hypothetical protein
LTTVMIGVLTVATSAAGIAAVTWVPDPKVVVRTTPLTCTTAPDTNPVPVTVSVSAALPAVTLDGVIAVIVGNGFGTLQLGENASAPRLLPAVAADPPTN